MKQTRLLEQKGFTLLELLVVIVIIVVLAGGAFVALNPARRFADSRDATRFTDTTAVLEAAKVDQVDNGGGYVAAIAGMTAGTNYMIGTATGVACDDAAWTGCDVVVADTNCVNLTDLVTEGYLAEVPVSPEGTGTWDGAVTGYYMNRSSTGALTVGACESENNTAISVSR